MIIRARCILTANASPLDNGAFKIKDGKIIAVGRYDDVRRENSGEVVDLQEVALAPGMVNAHCHLDYTDMAGMLPPPRQFPDWVKSILHLKAHWSFTEYAKSWLNGAKMLVESGTTTVADIEAVPELIPEVWESTVLRVISFFEMTGVKTNRAPGDILEETVAHAEKFTAEDSKHQFAISPHAPYSTTPELLKLASTKAEEKEWLISIHAAESEAEFAMFKSATGPFYDWLKGQRKMEDCGLGSPIEHLHRHGALTPRTLLIHANYLTDLDPILIARAQSSVVHCPRSHHYFGHAPFPWKKLKSAGINVALGTDSLASVLMQGKNKPVLDFREDIRLFCEKSGASPEEAFEMATVNGAKALQISDERGELKKNAHADFFTFPYTGRITQRNALEAFLFDKPPVIDVWLDGIPEKGPQVSRFG